MATRRKVWVYRPPKPARPKIPPALQQEADDKARELVESTLKPRYVVPPRPDQEFNYVADVFTTWFRSFLLCERNVLGDGEQFEGGGGAQSGCAETGGAERPLRRAAPRPAGRFAEVAATVMGWAPSWRASSASRRARR